jgi:hypothetical protein
MLQAIGNEELQNEYRNILKGFYGALKSKDGCIKFALLTGVTKFGKVSVFSDLNNLKDISMTDQYATICGMTEVEIRDVLLPYVERMAVANGISTDECLARLKQYYDGYHFCEDSVGMYNPFSLLNAFADNKFRSYWFETGTPTYLVELLQRDEYNLNDMEHSKVDADTLNSIDSTSRNPIPVIYQSGYLTIKSYNQRFQTYTLGFPNKEVEAGFTKFLLPWYTSKNKDRSAFDLQNYVEDLEAGNTDQFVKRLKALFADTPYMLIKDLENHYQNVVWLLSKLAGLYVQAEYMTSEGRIDLVLQTPKFCYVMEFKLDGTAEDALAQIEDKHYTLPFEMNGQKIIRLGINFSKETKNIEKVVVG